MTARWTLRKYPRSTLHDDDESPLSNTSPARTGKFCVKIPANEAKMGTKFITFDGKTGEEAATAEKHEEDEPDEDEEPIPSTVSL